MSVNSEAVNLSLNCYEMLGKFMNDNDVRRHPELVIRYFPYVFTRLNEIRNERLNLKKNLGSNSKESLSRAEKLYRFYLKSGKRFDEFPNYYLGLALRLIESEFGNLTYNDSLTYGDYGKPDWKLINDQRVGLLAPRKFVNDTKYVGVLCRGKWRIAYDYVSPLSFERVDKRHVFVLNAEQRRAMIRYLSRDDNCLFGCYVDVFKKYPIEAEYRLYILNENPDHFVGVKDWFDRHAGEFL